MNSQTNYYSRKERPNCITSALPGRVWLLAAFLLTIWGLHITEAQAHQPVNVDRTNRGSNCPTVEQSLSPRKNRGALPCRETNFHSYACEHREGKKELFNTENQQKTERNTRANHPPVVRRTPAGNPESNNRKRTAGSRNWHSFWLGTEVRLFSFFAVATVIIIWSKLAQMAGRPGGKSPGATLLESFSQSASAGNTAKGTGTAALSPPQSQAKTFQAREHLQYASDQATQAESAAGRAGCSGNRSAKLAAAEEAQYHANYAREAADRATAAAAGGPPEANDAAQQARNAAYRAQAAADRARYSSAT